MIQCHEIVLNIKDELLLKCDLSFKRGFVYVLKGENGSGKTSFLRALKGLFKYEGHFEINGTVIYQPQHFHLFQKHAKDNFFPDLKRANRFINYFGIEDLLDKSVNVLSGGERQKIALIRSVIQEYDVLLLDEPCSQMDQKSMEMTHALLFELAQMENKCILLVSHQIDESLNQAISLEIKAKQLIAPSTNHSAYR
ncbi:MAG TPA: hypothetical protein DIC19_05330 [Erysipelotrichaceae bacterium]|nr:hypothetical protein [Erysipelotrichaceae bacterium]